MPLPSSPHWAPRIDDGGHRTPPLDASVTGQDRRSPGNSAPGLLRHTLPKRSRTGPAARIVSRPWTRSSSSPTATPAPPTRRRSRRALAVLREQASVEVAGDRQPRRARRRAAPRRVAADRGGRRRRQPARGGRRPAPPQRPQGRRRSACCRSAPATTSPAAPASRSTSRRPPASSSTASVRPMDLIVDEVGEVVVNSVHVGAGAKASRRGAPLEGAARLDRGRQGQPRQAGLPDRAAADRLSTRRSSGCGSRSTARSSTTSTSRC